MQYFVVSMATTNPIKFIVPLLKSACQVTPVYEVSSFYLSKQKS